MTSAWETEEEEPVYNVDMAAQEQKLAAGAVGPTEPKPRVCAICNISAVDGMLRVCNDCWNKLTCQPKVHLRLEDSDHQISGVVMWDHNSIGASPHDLNPIPVGIWGKYGVEGQPQTYWVSLCKPIEAIHDMMTQLYAHIRDDNVKWGATYSKTIDTSGATPGYSTRRVHTVKEPEQPVEPAIDPAFDSLRAKIMKLRGGS